MKGNSPYSLSLFVETQPNFLLFPFPAFIVFTFFHILISFSPFPAQRVAIRLIQCIDQLFRLPNFFRLKKHTYLYSQKKKCFTEVSLDCKKWRHSVSVAPRRPSVPTCVIHSPFKLNIKNFFFFYMDFDKAICDCLEVSKSIHLTFSFYHSLAFTYIHTCLHTRTLAPWAKVLP